jgi:hypothetical protein
MLQGTEHHSMKPGAALRAGVRALRVSISLCPLTGCGVLCVVATVQEYIARFGHGSAKLARQAQSKEKTLEKMVRGGLTERVETDRVVKLHFENVGKLPPPVLQFSGVAFGYSPDKVLYR